MIDVRFGIIENPNSIFGSVGRCGGGYNSVWEDWSPDGVKKREAIMIEFENGLNKICGHYTKLEKNILSKGFRNPLIITCGPPLRRQEKHLPPWLVKKPKHEWLILEGTNGGSRLWIAQQHNMPVPCIINDQMGRFKNHKKLNTVEQVLFYYNDIPKKYSLDSNRGWWTGQLYKTHLEEKWNGSELDRQRRPMWKTIMKKHGYK